MMDDFKRVRCELINMKIFEGFSGFESHNVHRRRNGGGGRGGQWPLHFSDWGAWPSTFLTILF